MPSPALEPESSVSTNSTTWAFFLYIMIFSLNQVKSREFFYFFSESEEFSLSPKSEGFSFLKSSIRL